MSDTEMESIRKWIPFCILSVCFKRIDFWVALFSCYNIQMFYMMQCIHNMIPTEIRIEF